VGFVGEFGFEGAVLVIAEKVVLFFVAGCNLGFEY
jgi:hypothetical protein